MLSMDPNGSKQIATNLSNSTLVMSGQVPATEKIKKNVRKLNSGIPVPNNKVLIGRTGSNIVIQGG